MQTTQLIRVDRLPELVGAVYSQGEVHVKEAYSAYDSPTTIFPHADALMAELSELDSKSLAFFTLYYPEAGGYVEETRIELNSEKCGGHAYRFKQDGWGLIGLQCRLRGSDLIECRVAVNSAARASNWSDSHPASKDPSLWDWKVVETKAGRLIRLLRKLAKAQVEQAGGADA